MTTTTVSPPARATLEDLMATEGKAELIGGRIVEFMATGYQPHKVALNILLSLIAFAKVTRLGKVLSDNIGYAVPELTSGRESFSPDVSFYTGPIPSNRMGFIEGVPEFAVEIRSENDYGRPAERDMAAKRDDYFEAGTIVVWDVDTEAQTVAKYTASTANRPQIFRLGEMADAEPAVPGWTISVEEIMTVD